MGVLKAGTVTFHPPLPEWKQQAINNLGFGLLNKVGLKCDVDLTLSLSLSLYLRLVLLVTFNKH